MSDLELRAPETLAECAALLADAGDQARVLAGGTALVPLLKQRLVRPRLLVSLHRVPGLTGVTSDDGGGLLIGARTTLRDLETSPLVAGRLPALRDTLALVAGVRIRGQATIGGNLAHGDPLMDAPATLLALDAAVLLAGPGGDREVPLAAFYRGPYATAAAPGEVVTGVRVPAQPPGAAAVYLKFRPRTATDYPTVGVAARLSLDAAGAIEDARLALAGAAPTTVRAVAAEDLLGGERPGDAAFAAAAAAVRQAVFPASDLRGSADYKREMAEVFARRALHAAHEALEARA